MDNNSLFAAMQGDKKIVLKEQVLRIEEEIKEREKVDRFTLDVIEQEILEIQNEILKLRPMGPSHGASAELRKELQEMEKEKLVLSKEKRVEKRDAWKDVQVLKQEERDVEKELSQIEKRRERYKEMFSQ